MPGTLSLIVRAGAGVNTIDVAAASQRGIYVSNCPGKNAVAVAELAFGLILALDRRVPDNVAELRAGTWNKKEFSEGERPVRPDARAARLRQHRPGSGAARARVRHAGAGLEPALRRGRGDRGDGPPQEFDIEVVATPAEAVARGRHRQRAPGADEGHPRLRRRASCSVTLKPGAILINTARARSGGLRGARRSGPREGHARRASTCSPTSRRARQAAFDDPIVSLPGVYRHAPHRRLDRSGAGSDRRRDRAHRRDLQGHRQGAERRQPGRARRRRRTCSWCGIATGPACWRTCSSACATRDLNVQETENIIFDGRAGRRRAHQSRRRAADAGNRCRRFRLAIADML